ncbi:PAS domain S-box protein [Terasakiella sp. A23]|uniref:PAS domain S-box protein n=1 Tax=Terasakiella sp. FCG-A23 TaxID=3080561 RepID=UPI002954AC66|nr:PAS domain S-box protein [Terasakiella sp. A23]MDV7338515.1 PAS domain S-box protein [Terasakiella sp. A23]
MGRMTNRIVGGAVLLTLIVFGADLLFPLGVAMGVGYVVPVILISRTRSSTHVWTCVFICSLLIAVGYFLSDMGSEEWIVLTNRLLSLGAIWAVGYGLLRHLKSERVTNRSRQELLSFLNASTDYAALVEQDGTIVIANKNLEDMYEDERKNADGTLTGMPMFREPITELGRRRQKWHQRVFETGNAFEQIDKDGDHYYSNRYHPVLDDEGNVYRVAISVRDLTKEKEAEKLWLASEQRFKDLLENSIQGVYVHKEWNLLFANNAMARILGYEKVDDFLKLENVEQFIAPEERDRLHQYRKNRENGMTAPTQHIARYLKKDGTKVWLESFNNLVTWYDEQVVQTTVVDVTERVIAEQKSMVASQAKSDFLSLLSHEFRTPLNSINGFVQLLLGNSQSNLTDKQLEMLTYIQHNGDELLYMVDKLIEFTALEDADFNPETLHVNQIVSDVLEAHQHVGEKSKVHLVNTSSNCCSVKCSETHLKRILGEFVENAIKFNIEDGTVIVKCMHHHGDMVRIRVEDSGQGIIDKHKGDLFQPFNRLGRENGSIPGVGIGLCVAQKTAEQIGGNIGFEPNQEGGSIFWVDVPSADQSAE